MSFTTKSQKMAQSAYDRVANRKPDKEYVSFARSFPSLIHSCGLAQAIAYAIADAKRPSRGDYLNDLSAVMRASGHSEATSPESMASAIRTQPMTDYVRMSRNALLAAGWLKRYADAVQEG